MLLAVVSTSLHGQTTPQQKPSAEFDPAPLRAYIREQMARAQIPAIVISVTQGRKIIWEEGFGLADRERSISATPQTPFYLASVTKAITGTAVLTLHDRGKIDLDRPVNEYLGEAKVHSPMWNPAEATIRRVATHTAGLTTYSRKCAVQNVECKVSLDIAIRRYGILFWPPGDHFDYSNLGYGILGEVVSRVSTKSYEQFLRDQVFRPLGMTGCFLENESGQPKQIAAQYDSSSHARTSAEASDTPGASSAHCSAHDLALLGMFALGENLPNQKRILSEASLHELVNPTVETGDGERYGFGWSLQSDYHGYVGVYAQGGTNDSFAVLQLIPSEKIAVAVIANTGTTVPFEIVDQTLRGLLPDYRETVAKTDQPGANTKTAAPTALAGTWVGALDTWKGSVPLTLAISPVRQVQVRRGNQWTTASDVDIAASRFYCVIPNQVATPHAPPSDLELELYLHGEILIGAGTTKDGAQLPYWVQLHRSPEGQAAPSAH
jgi:CubicO group peptidase (beta-lactamase class C family)